MSLPRRDLVYMAEACFDSLGAVERDGQAETARCLRWVAQRLTEELHPETRWGAGYKEPAPWDQT